MHMWESVKEIQYYCGRLDFRHLVDKRMAYFFGNIHKTNNAIVQNCVLKSPNTAQDIFKRNSSRRCSTTTFILERAKCPGRIQRRVGWGGGFCLQFWPSAEELVGCYAPSHRA